MSSIENRLLSKLIDEGNITELVKYNVTDTDFFLQGETVKFIKGYIREFGQAPAYSEVVAECKDFEYTPEVADSIPYLCKKLKGDNAKRRAFELLQQEAGTKFSELGGIEFSKWLFTESEKLVELSKVDLSTGTNFATNGEERAQWYADNKENRTNIFIPTPYPSLTNWLGGGTELGDYILIQAYSNKGKSWIASDFGIKAWESGSGVLHYSPELSTIQQIQRLDTLKGKFRNSSLKIGALKNEESYLNYLAGFNESNTVPYIVKTMEDLQQGLSLETIEADLQANENIKMVIIDGFTLMKHTGRNNNRDSMTNTSRKLRQLFGKYKVVGVVVHQIPTEAEKNNSREDEDGLRIVKPPELHQYSETVAVIQDACTVLNFDQFEGVGKIRLAKSRTPFVNKILDLQCDFDIGLIKEVTAIDYI